MKLRTLLFAPADAPSKVAHALASPADVVILDLEDSVAATAKDAARVELAGMLAQAAHPCVMVRINAQDTAWYLPDLAALAAAGAGLAGIMLPKCGGAADLAQLDQQLAVLEVASGRPEGGISVLALVTETPQAVLNMDYRGATARLRALCFGAEDLAASLGIAPRRADGIYRAPLGQARAQLLLAAAAAGLPAIDTPYPDPKNPDALVAEAQAAAADGFAGKLCIHPAQIAVVQQAFTPDAARLAWAQSVVAAFAAQPDAGVIAMEGRMVDRPHLLLAQRLLD